MEKLTGTIAEKVNIISLGYAKVPKIGKVFFNLNTEFVGTSFDSLVVGQKVVMKAIKTEGGIVATRLEIKKAKEVTAVNEIIQ